MRIEIASLGCAIRYPREPLVFSKKMQGGGAIRSRRVSNLFGSGSLALAMLFAVISFLSSSLDRSLSSVRFEEHRGIILFSRVRSLLTSEAHAESKNAKASNAISKSQRDNQRDKGDRDSTGSPTLRDDSGRVPGDAKQSDSQQQAQAILPETAIRRPPLASGVITSSSSIDAVSAEVSIPFVQGQTCHHGGVASAEVAHILAADSGQVLTIAKTGEVCIWQGLQSAGIGMIPKNFSAVALDPVSKKLAVAVGQQVSIFALRDVPIQGSGSNQGEEDKPSVVGPGRAADQKLVMTREIGQIGTGISALDFHPDGESLLLGGLDGKIYRWRLNRAEHGLLQTDRADNLERYFGHSAVISALAMHSFGNIFLSGDWNGVVSIWALYDADSAKGELDRDLLPGKYFSDASERFKIDREPSDEILSIKISLDGEIFALATAGGAVEVWKVRGVKKLATIQAHRGDIFSFDLDRNGRYLLSLGRDGLLKRWELAKAPDADKVSIGDAESESLTSGKNVLPGDRNLEMLLKPLSVNSDKSFCMAAFDVSGKVVVGSRDGRVFREK